MNPLRYVSSVPALLLATCLFLPATTAQPVTWQPLPGPEGPVVRDLRTGPDGLLLASEAHHTYQYDPADGHWTLLFRYVVDNTKEVLALDFGPDGTRWVGADGVYEFPVSGPNPVWHPIRSSQHSSHHPVARHLAVSPAGTVLVGAFGFNVWDDGYRSPNAGETWLTMSINPTAFAFADGTTWAGTEHGVFRSTNEGAGWSARNAGISDEEMAAVAVTPTGAVVAGSTAGVWRSTDEGASWALASEFPDVLALIADEASERVWAGTASGLYRSDDGGASWTGPLAGLPGPHVQALARDEAGTLYAATGSAPPFYLSESTTGVFRSTDGGNTWTAFQKGLPVQALTAGLETDDALYVASSSDGVHRSTSDGALWSEQNEGLPTHHVRDLVQTASGDLILITGPSAAGRGSVFRSDDETASWVERASGLPEAELLSLAVGADDRLFVTLEPITGHERLYRSDDGGQTWTLALGSGALLAVEANPAGIAFVLWDDSGTSVQGAYVSTNNGATWARTADVPGFVSTQAFPAIDDDGRLYIGHTNGLLRSDDLGQSWTEIGPLGEPFGFGNWLLTLSFEDDALYAGTMGGVFRSTDDGSSWEPASTGLPEIFPDQIGAVPVLFHADDILLAGTEEFGVFTSGTPPNPPVATEPDGAVPHLALQAAYPNPFRARTTLGYTLPASAEVRIVVYDVLGREIQQLAEGTFAAGRHETVFERRGLPSGVYFVRLETDSAVQTQRVTVVR